MARKHEAAKTVRICRPAPAVAGTCGYFLDLVYEEVPVIEVRGQWALHKAGEVGKDGSPNRRQQGGCADGYNVTHVPTGMALAGYLTEETARSLLAGVHAYKPRGSIFRRGPALLNGMRPPLRALVVMAEEAVAASRKSVSG